MTIKLYDKDPHLTTFKAQVLSCEKMPDGNYAIILDQTAFFPEEGGQDCDEGTLNEIKVDHVAINKDNTITHFLSKPIPAGNTVNGILDYATRFDRMQQHTGEHILSGLIHNLYGFDNVGFHLSSDYTTFDTNGVLSDDEVIALEKAANKIIADNLKVRTYFPDKAQLDTLSYRSKIDIDGEVRLVEIPGVDLCACCAPHVDYTGQIGQIKIVDYKRHRGGMRFTILCGMRALSYSQENTKILSFLSKELSVPFERIQDAFIRLKEDAFSKQGRINELQEKLLQCSLSLLPSPDTVDHAVLFVDSMDMKAVRNIVNKLAASYPNYSAVFSGCDETGYQFIMGAGKDGDVSHLGSRLLEKLSAKCGGSAKMIQGSLCADKAAILSLLEA